MKQKMRKSSPYLLASSIFLGIVVITGILGTMYTPCVSAAVINVPTDQASIQEAIDASWNGDEIIVQPGIYEENINFLGKVITVRSLNPNDPGVTAATVIDGNGMGRVVEFSNGEGNGSVLTGFTVQNGNGGIYCEGSSPAITNCTITYNEANYGGGIYCIESSPQITNCTIIYNRTSQEDGGGIFCGTNSSPTISNCNIIHNSSYGDGGAIYSASSSPIIDHSKISFNRANYGGGIYSDGPMNISNCTIENNSSYDEGGGIYCFGALSATNCTITDNSSLVDGGGIYCGDSSSITDSIVNANSSDRYGGGIYCSGTLSGTNSEISENWSFNEGGGIYCDGSVSLTDCTLSSNSSYGDGGGVYCGNSSTISECNINNNFAYEGGGVYCFGSLIVSYCILSDNASYGNGGGIFCGDSSEITKSSFTSNLANQGGGIYSNGLLTIINCTLGNNSSYDKGGAMYCDGPASITNCTITENFANQGGGIFCEGSVPSEITNSILWSDTHNEISYDVIPPIVIYSDIQGGYSSTNNNIDTDPLFVDPDIGDYHLTIDSPCINAGTSDNAPIEDKDDNFRDKIPDLGAYEYMNRPPELNPIGNKEVSEGTRLQFKIEATDPDEDPLTYSVSQLPPRADFNPDTQIFSWTPSYEQSGTYTLNFIVSDIGTPPLIDSEKVTIIVRNVKKFYSYWWWYPQRYQYLDPSFNQQRPLSVWEQQVGIYLKIEPLYTRYQNPPIYQPHKSYQPYQSYQTYQSYQPYKPYQPWSFSNPQMILWDMLL